MAGDAYAVLCCLVLPWLLINGADAVWIYFYIYASIHPNPRIPVNITHSGWTGYIVMMFLFGWVWGCVNLAVFWGYFSSSFAFDSGRQGMFSLFVVAPIATVLILGPFISPFIALPLAQRTAWIHGCDGYPIQIVIDAKAYNGPSYQPNIASYFQGYTPLYSYDIFQSSADQWSFNIRTINSPDLAQNHSAPLYPSISNITYDFIYNTVSANCTFPSSNTTSTCVTGSFNPNNYLSFNLTDLRSNSTTYLHAVDKEWAFGDDAPSVILKDSNGVEVIRTDVTKKGDCTQLKLCAAQDSGAGITVPVGLILMRQMDYSVYCTTPSDDSS